VHTSESPLPPSRRLSVRLDGNGRAWLLVAAVTALTLLTLGFVGGLRPPPEPVHVPWWAMAGVFYLAEAYLVFVRRPRDANTVSLSELGIVFGLFFTSPAGLVAAQLLGGGVARKVLRRERSLKTALGLAHSALGTCLAILVFHEVAGLHDSRVLQWTAAFLAAGVAKGTGMLLGALAVSLAERREKVAELIPAWGMSFAATTANTSLALASVELLQERGPAVVLVIGPFLGSILMFQAYATQRRRHEHLGFLYESMRRMQAAREIEPSMRELLTSMRQMFRAEHAEIVLVSPENDGRALRSVIRSDGEALMESSELGELERLGLESASSVKGAMIVARRRTPNALDVYLRERDLHEAMLTALRGEKRVFGLLLVGDRASDLSAFTDEDRQLFETFASHAAVLLENDHLAQSLVELTALKEQLHHQAHHDALTGLPNRRLFTQKVAEAVADARDGGAMPAVLFVDLDDFKTVNDSLGHAAGDELLIGVAGRVATSIRPQDVPARLGGDEFAALIRVARPEDAHHIAERLVEAIGVPFVVKSRGLSVHASVGIAVGSEGVSAEELLRNADVAMYRAKGGGKRQYATFEPEMHAEVRRRQELAGDLERALARDEIDVHYQPIVDLDNGSTVAVEALARWDHPKHGRIPPLEFVSLAEETGLIESLSRVVLRRACRDVRSWRSRIPSHANLVVSVNVSPRELHRGRLTERVGEALDATGLPAGALLLEITESGALEDPETTVAEMTRLRDLGVRIALDDFGTGHSSLSHLRQLPLDVLKIAKPFVDSLGSDEVDATIAAVIIRMAEVLRLSVIAEGIESGRQEEALRQMGCPHGQGYLFARPANADATENRLLAVELRKASGL